MGIKKKDIFDNIRRNQPYFEDFITRSVYHSNAIEGNTISFAETYAILFNDNSMKVTSTPRELYEAINLKYAFHYVLENLDAELSLAYIKKIAELINKNITDLDDFRKIQVFIRGAEYIPVRPELVLQELSYLLYKEEPSEDEDIFDYLARFHITFERIHPFEDGNGRTGRVLITKELLSKGYAPIVIPLEKRADYFEFLAGQNIKGLGSMFRQLHDFELERMKTFGITVNK